LFAQSDQDIVVVLSWDFRVTDQNATVCSQHTWIDNTVILGEPSTQGGSGKAITMIDTLASLLGISSCAGMVQGLSRIETSGGLSVA